MSLNPFTWFGNKKATPETKTYARRPSLHDMTGGLPANEELLLGLFHGSYAGLEKASPMARVPVIIPANMMGQPTPTSKDAKTQIVLDEIREMMAQEIKTVNKMFILIGTSWVYPKWDRQRGLIWKVLRDSHVTDMLLSLQTELPIGIVVDEQINVSVGENSVQTIRRKTTYTPTQVTVLYQGKVSEDIKDYSMRNVAGVLPVMFAHEPDDMISRGHSILEPVLCDLKDYHDIDYRASETLARFRVKQIQHIGSGKLKEWRHNNGLDSDSELEAFDVADQDLLFCVGADEDTKYVFLPEGATAASEKALERLYWKVIEGTETPEIFFGGAVSGNMGSYEGQLQMMVTKVQGLREEVSYAYTELFKASLRLRSLIDMTKYDMDFEMGWNRLESISEKDKATMLAQFATAVSALVTSGGVGIKQLYQLWKTNYPELEYGTEEEFKAELVKNANLQQFLKQDYATGESMIEAAGSEANVINNVNKDESDNEEDLVEEEA